MSARVVGISMANKVPDMKTTFTQLTLQACAGYVLHDLDMHVYPGFT